MDIQALKLALVEKIIHTEEPSLLLKITSMLQKETEDDDWWEKLPSEVQESILEGLKDVKEGNTFTHEQVMQEVKQKYDF